MKTNLLLIVITLFVVSCKVKTTPSAMIGEVNKKGKTEILTGKLVEKAFVRKDRKGTNQMELYLRCSIQDYFIKWCESDVSSKELSKYLDKGVTLEVEIIDGEFDICEGDPEGMQSRMGNYIAIKKIIE